MGGAKAWRVPCVVMTLVVVAATSNAEESRGQTAPARFESGARLLSPHHDGREARRRVRTSAGTLEQAAVFAIGPAVGPTAVTESSDRGDGIVHGVRLAFSPAALPRLSVGATFRTGLFPTLRDDAARPRGIGDVTEGAYLEYLGSNFEAVGGIGLYPQRHRATNRAVERLVGYLQLGYRLGPVTPFTRLDSRDTTSGGLFRAADGVDLDEWEQVVGIRYEWKTHLAFKVEGAGGRTQRLSVAGDDLTRAFGRVTFQLAWVF